MRALAIATVLLAVVFSGCTREPTEPREGEATPAEGPVAKAAAGDTANGKDVYMRICADCHGPVGEGVETLGNPLRANDLVKNASDAALVDLLVKGRSTSDPANRTGMTMPPRGGDPKVTDGDLVDVVAFLRTIQ